VGQTPKELRAGVAQLGYNLGMATNAVVRSRINADVKEKATAVLEEMGLTVSDVMRIVLTRVANENALPFDLKPPISSISWAGLLGITENGAIRFRAGFFRFCHSVEEFAGDQSEPRVFEKPVDNPFLFVTPFTP
jgi:addiction module RelB/DinJ family antitoxin